MTSRKISKLLKLWYFIPLVILSLTPVLWFIGKGDVLINGVDTNFPLDPAVWFERRFYVWNSVPNAGQDFSSSTAGLFFHLIQYIPFKLGFSLQLVEIFSLVFWFSLIVTGSYFFARLIFLNKYIIQLLFSVIYSFNVYIFNTWENVKVANLALVAGIPFALGVLVLLKDKKMSRSIAAIYSLFIGVILSGAGINPAYFVAFILAISIYVLSRLMTNFTKKKLLESLTDLGTVMIPIILVNAFWILPTTNFIITSISSSNSIANIGFTNWVDSLSQNTSILNILRLQGAWDWYAFDGISGLPLYIPYAVNYLYSFPFIVFSFVLIIFAILALIFRKKGENKDLYITFSLMLVLGVFLGVGTHAPTGIIYVWLLKYLPFFSLFRSPWYIFTPLTVLALAGLVGLLFDSLDRKLQLENMTSIHRRVLKLTLHSFVILLILSNLIYAYPLVTGKIFRPNQNNGFFVDFPDYVFQSKVELSKLNKDSGRIIGYPEDEIERFKWGYTGIESILSLFSDHETIFSGLSNPDPKFSLIVKRFYEAIKKNQIESAEIIAGKLNVQWLFEKQDQSSLSEKLPSQFNKLPNMKVGEWVFYKLPPENFIPKVFAATNLFFVYPYNIGAEAITLMGNSDVFLNPEDSVITKVPKIELLTGDVVIAENSQVDEMNSVVLSPSRLANRLINRDLTKVIYTFEVQKAGAYQPILEKYKVSEFGIDYTKGLQVDVDGSAVLWEFDKESEGYIYFKSINFPFGEHRALINLVNQNLITGGDIGEGNPYLEIGSDKGVFERHEENKNKYLSIINLGNEDVHAEFDIQNFDPIRHYYIEVQYRQIYGNNPNVLVSQSDSKTKYKTQVERMPNHPEWKGFSLYFEPVKVQSNTKIWLVAPLTKDPLGTKILYDNLKVYKVFSNNLVLVRQGQVAMVEPTVQFTKVSPVEYQVDLSGAHGPHILIFSENFNPLWQMEIYSQNGEKLTVNPAHFSANLFANGWYLEGTPDVYKAKITYKAQKYFLAGGIVSIVSVGAIAGFYIFSGMRRRK